jgi:hypothetical protein
MSVGLPNLIIPGVQKSGTSSLHAYLAVHPQCVMSSPKEPNFFTANWSKYDVQSYLDCLAPTAQKEDVRIVGEASTSYFSHPSAPARIQQVLGPETRILVLLRNPIERAVSAYWHMAKRFAERRSLENVVLGLPSELSSAVLAEHDRLRAAQQFGLIDTQLSVDSIGQKFWNFQYIRNSAYLINLKRFVSVFGRDRVHVVLAEELDARPADTLASIAVFLGISPQGFATRYRLNATRIPRSGRGVQTVHKLVRRLPGGPLRRMRHRLLALTTCSPPVTCPAVRMHLERLFSQHNAQLSEYLARDLSIWNAT